jgi:hypothetical protein
VPESSRVPRGTERPLLRHGGLFSRGEERRIHFGCAAGVKAVIYYGHLAPGRYLVGDDGVARKAAPPKRLVAEGWACAYNVVHKNYRTNGDELFLPGCFTGTLWGAIFLRDHRLNEPKMADESDGDMELLDSDQGLAIRVHLSEGVLERLEGRRELSVGYHTMNSNIRADGVRVIQKAALVEVSACDVAAVRQCFLDIRDADDVGPLAIDSKNWASEGASRGFLRALRKLQ